MQKQISKLILHMESVHFAGEYKELADATAFLPAYNLE